MTVAGAMFGKLSRLHRVRILALAVAGVGIVGVCDYLTGFEVSMSLFYVAPVALAAWYAGRWTGVFIAVLSCLSWYSADLAAGSHYSHPLIPVWNSLVRLGFFLVCSLLLTTLRKTLINERHLACTDALTGLYGRRAYEEQLEHDLALAQRLKSCITLAYIDLDDFKGINDTHGHGAGDRVLQVTAQVLKNLTRRVDTAARLGGDEFAVVLPDTDQTGAQQAIAHLVREMQEAYLAINLKVTCSIGVVTFIDTTISASDAVAMADALMYEVKRQGKGAVAYNRFGTAPSAEVAAV